MIQQLPLALKLEHAPGLDDFVVGGNRSVLDALRASLQPDGEKLVYLFGPSGCGRSHLLLGQCASAEAIGMRSIYLPLTDHATLAPQMLEGLESFDLLAVDNVHEIAGKRDWEEALFALFNRTRDLGNRLLFSADCGPAALPLTLPDLRSRLAWGLALSIQPLDDDGRRRLLQHLASRRALKMPDDVARFIVERGSRHPKDLVDMVNRLDRASLAEQRRLTIPFVKQNLAMG